MKDININTIYDLIILPFNTFCYLYTLEDLKQFFAGIKKVSNNNTIIVIDIINLTKSYQITDINEINITNNNCVNVKNCNLNISFNGE